MSTQRDLEHRILTVRAARVILDRDLAAAYGVTTSALNQAMKRNVERFPPDFAFRLSAEEAEAIRRSRSQTVILKRGQNVKHLPFAFTEHGALMAASILSSPRAIEMSIFVVRAFVRLRDVARRDARFAAALASLEKRVAGHDRQLADLLIALRVLAEPAPRVRRRIGFRNESSRLR